MSGTVRNVLGSILALAGATAAVWSPFRPWYDGRHGRDYRIVELFSGGGVSDASARLFVSLLLPFAFVALVTLVGVVLRSRPTVALAGLICIGFTVLWMVRVGQAQGYLSVDAQGNGLGIGTGLAFLGGVALLLAALIMAGRPSARTGFEDERGQRDEEEHGQRDERRYRDEEWYPDEPGYREGPEYPGDDQQWYRDERGPGGGPPR